MGEVDTQALSPKLEPPGDMFPDMHQPQGVGTGPSASPRAIWAHTSHFFGANTKKVDVGVGGGKWVRCPPKHHHQKQSYWGTSSPTCTNPKVCVGGVVQVLDPAAAICAQTSGFSWGKAKIVGVGVGGGKWVGCPPKHYDQN